MFISIYIYIILHIVYDIYIIYIYIYKVHGVKSVTTNHYLVTVWRVNHCALFHCHIRLYGHTKTSVLHILSI